MKITIPKKDLERVVNTAKHATASRILIPIQAHLLLQAHERSQSLSISATDLQSGLEIDIRCHVDTPGEITLPAQRLSSILAEWPDGDIRIHAPQTEDNSRRVHLVSGSIKTTLYSSFPEEFPVLHRFADDNSPNLLEQKTLKHLLSQVSFAISKDDTRKPLTGLLLEFQEDRLVAVATNSHLLSYCAMTKGRVYQPWQGHALIPGTLIKQLERLLSPNTGEIEVRFDSTHAGFTFDGTRIVGSLLEGTFPKYSAVIPKHDKHAWVETKPFREALRRCQSMTNDKWKTVRIHLDTGEMTLHVITPEVGEYNEKLQINYTGNPVEVAFNPAYIMYVVQRIDSDQVCIEVKDPQHPGLFKPHPDDGSDYLNVIMPVRV